jgi:hypothetical protein
MPGPDVQIGSLDVPILVKARSLAPSYPSNLIRIQEIRDTLVYRYTHGRQRVVVWLDRDRSILWVCAADERDGETYDSFVDLHEHGELLPSYDDELRLAAEAATRFADSIADELPVFLAEARASQNTELVRPLRSGGEIRMLVSTTLGVEELWVALPTLQAPGGLTPRMRALALVVLERELNDAVWEQRYDWPTGQLADYEIAHLGLSKATQS